MVEQFVFVSTYQLRSCLVCHFLLLLIQPAVVHRDMHFPEWIFSSNQYSLFCSKMAKLEELEEVDLSGNRLKAVPTTILNCRRMHTLVAHSNCIEVFPEVMQLMEMKVRSLTLLLFSVFFTLLSWQNYVKKVTTFKLIKLVVIH